MFTALRLCVASLGLFLACLPARADFHLFTINEIYSNADGTVQFIELTALAGGQQFLTGHSIVSSAPGGTHTYVFTSNLPGDTAGRKFLMGTAGFAALGVVAPDYVVPDGFLFPAGGTLDWGPGYDVWAHGAIPTDGTSSLNRDGSTGVNSPTNFAGATGQVGPPAPMSANIGVTQSPSPNPGNVGKDVIFTMTVTNAGPAVATEVVLTDTLPPGTTYVWVSLDCGVAGFTVTCPVGTLASGASAQRKLVVRPNAAGVITNNVTVSALQVDPVSSNNSSASDVTINTNPAPVAVLRYRLYSPVTLEHHFTTDLNEYTVLGAQGGWEQEGTVGKVLNNPGSFNGVEALPYYRLYNDFNHWHHWTTDANEYYTLLTFPGWNGEGVDGYILPVNTTGAIQLYRLVYPNGTGLHHWTVDSNEYTTLIATYGWVGEGGAGFVIQ